MGDDSQKDLSNFSEYQPSFQKEKNVSPKNYKS